MLIKDVIPGFELYQPSTIDDALTLLGEHGKKAWKIAGGNDSLSWFKDRAKRPEVVIDLTGIAEMKGIRATDEGIEIGALTSLTEIERDPMIKEKYRVLADAAGKVASPQIRNSGTIGGNLNQDTRCWYYRAGLPCYRAGGNTCFADTPEAMNREHTIFDANRCVAVTPSDLAPVMVVLDAKMVLRKAGSERVVDAEDFFIGPAIDITRMTVVEPDEMLVAVRIPGDWAGAKFYFEKVTDRQTWDFPLVNVAAALKVSNGVVERARVACGGVECTPRRITAAEQVVTGKTVNEGLIRAAGQTSTRGARPLNFNHFKVPLMANLVMRAIRNAA
ncbi:MAG: xanthine dehydrogenase family protein subunit M [Hyphomicrobiales bacterium]|nr:xanthine dehydrogenase family protein subunit M [Hyphomicrobiales bacterium]